MTLLSYTHHDCGIFGNVGAGCDLKCNGCGRLFNSADEGLMVGQACPYENCSSHDPAPHAVYANFDGGSEFYIHGPFENYGQAYRYALSENFGGFEVVRLIAPR